MSHFVVSFMKDVLGDYGRQIEICQRTVEIDGSARRNGFANGRCMPTASRSRWADYPS